MSGRQTESIIVLPDLSAHLVGAAELVTQAQEAPRLLSRRDDLVPQIGREKRRQAKHLNKICGLTPKLSAFDATSPDYGLLEQLSLLPEGSSQQLADLKASIDMLKDPTKTPQTESVLARISTLEAMYRDATSTIVTGVESNKANVAARIQTTRERVQATFAQKIGPLEDELRAIDNNPVVKDLLIERAQRNEVYRRLHAITEVFEAKQRRAWYAIGKITGKPNIQEEIHAAMAKGFRPNDSDDIFVQTRDALVTAVERDLEAQNSDGNWVKRPETLDMVCPWLDKPRAEAEPEDTKARDMSYNHLRIKLSTASTDGTMQTLVDQAHNQKTAEATQTLQENVQRLLNEHTIIEQVTGPAWVPYKSRKPKTSHNQ